MEWRKLGRIFEATPTHLLENCDQFAQAPQALVFDHFVRIYFSTRSKDPSNGKYLSHVSFVDMEKNLTDTIGVCSNTVIELGKPGCYDEHGIFPFNVLRRRNEIYGYIGGWNRRVSVAVDTSIGLAISRDNGLTFQRIGDGPVLSSSPREPFLVGDPFVAMFEDTFHMWYIFGTQWKALSNDDPPDRTYKIGHAISEDGIAWSKNEDGRQIIEDRLGQNESQALPTVAYFNGCYHMFFCWRQSFDFRRNRSRAYRIGYAYSTNLRDWTRDDANVGIDVTEGDWDSDMLCYPHVFHCNGRVYLLYNGNEFGRLGFGLAVLESM